MTSLLAIVLTAGVTWTPAVTPPQHCHGDRIIIDVRKAPVRVYQEPKGCKVTARRRNGNYESNGK